MSAFDPRSPTSRAVTTRDPEDTPPRVLETTSGVIVTVRHRPPPQPVRKPDPPERFPTVIVLPLDQPASDREAFIAELCAQHGPFVRDLLDRRRDVLEESRKDLQQRVLMVLVNHLKEVGAPENVRGFLTDVVRKEVANHRRRWRPEIQHGADLEAQLSNAPDPEGTAELAERRAKLERYLVHLPQEEAELVLCLDLYEMTLEQTALAVRRPRSTVAASTPAPERSSRRWRASPSGTRPSARAASSARAPRREALR